MTDEQIEKAAQQHADKCFLKDVQIFFNKPYGKAEERYVKTLADFAKYCLASQWMSVEERLPEEGTIVTAHSPNGRIDVLKYHDGEFVDELGQAHCVDYFIPIPPLNPEHPDNPE